MRWNRQKSEDRRQTALLIARQYSPILRSFVDAKLAEEKERERRMEVMLQPLRFQS
jgi:hypothetical protein